MLLLAYLLSFHYPVRQTFPKLSIFLSSYLAANIDVVVYKYIVLYFK